MGDVEAAAPRAADLDREVMTLLAAANADLLVSLLRGGEPVEGDPVMIALATARNLGVVVEDILRCLARQARRDGHTWAEIGAVLHVTRQAALQRFGGPADDINPSGRPLPRAATRATKMLDCFLDRRWQQLRDDFDGRMLDACSAELLGSVRARMADVVGEFIEMGTPKISTLDGYTVVDVPLVFARGRRTGRVTYNGQGQVAGFFVLPAAPEATGEE